MAKWQWKHSRNDITDNQHTAELIFHIEFFLTRIYINVVHTFILLSSTNQHLVQPINISCKKISSATCWSGSRSLQSPCSLRPGINFTIRLADSIVGVREGERYRDVVELRCHTSCGLRSGIMDKLLRKSICTCHSWTATETALTSCQDCCYDSNTKQKKLQICLVTV